MTPLLLKVQVELENSSLHKSTMDIDASLLRRERTVCEKGERRHIKSVSL